MRRALTVLTGIVALLVVEGVRPVSAGSRGASFGQQHGTCTDPNVAAWFDMSKVAVSSTNSRNRLITIPSGCTYAGVTFGENPAEWAFPFPPFRVKSSFQVPAGLAGAVYIDSSDSTYLLSPDTTTLEVSSNSMVGEIVFKTDPPYTAPHVYTTSSFSGFEILVSKGGTSIVPGWFFFLECNTTGVAGLELDGAGSTGLDLLSSVAVCDGLWHYARWTWNGHNFATLAVDGGTPTTSATTVGTLANSRPAAIGIRDTGADRPFAGWIADLRITIGNTSNNLGFHTVSRNLRISARRRFLLLAVALAAGCGNATGLVTDPTPTPPVGTPATPTPMQTIPPCPVPTPIWPSPAIAWGATGWGNSVFQYPLGHRGDICDGDDDAFALIWPCTYYPGDPNPPSEVVLIWDYEPGGPWGWVADFQCKKSFLPCCWPQPISP